MMLYFDRWMLTRMELDIRRLSEMWMKLQHYPTLFSDETKGDIKNWITLVQDESYIWFEVWEKEEIVGLIYAQILGDDAELHAAFFDRQPAAKRDLMRFFCRFMFHSLPNLARISCTVPAIYYGTCRLCKSIGKWEGTKRSAVLIGGRRVDVHLYGLLRTEAYGIPEREGQRGQYDASGYKTSAERNQPATAAGTKR